MVTEDGGTVQQDSIVEGKDVVETPVVEDGQPDDVQKLGELQRLIDEKAADKVETERRKFQSLKDTELKPYREKNRQLENQLKRTQAETMAQREIFFRGLSPEERQQAEGVYAQQVEQTYQHLSKPSEEEQRVITEATKSLGKLYYKYDIEPEKDPRIDMTTPYTAKATAEALLAELAKPKEIAKEAPKVEPVKKNIPKVDEGGSKSSSENDDAFIKAYAKGERNSPTDHKRANKILTGG